MNPCLPARRAFSLIELLLSVFILAIGIISVSALFPAGIAQQQQSTDDQLGPVVAEQALGLLRSRVSPEDFGTFEEFRVTNVLAQSIQGGNASYVFRPCAGDWSWIRPALIKSNLPGTPGFDDAGAIDIFAYEAQVAASAGEELCEFPAGVQGPGGRRIFGVPYNTARSAAAPRVVVTQRERWWPAAAEGTAVTDPPQYAWDCMFRRHGGRVQVAIFVYRVVGVGGVARPYLGAALDGTVATGYPDQPPVPYRRVMVSPGAVSGTATSGPPFGLQVPAGWQQPSSLSLTAQNPFTTGRITSTQGLTATDFVATQVPQVSQQWQFPGQWLIDNNGNVHRVAQGRRMATDPVQVRLSAPVPRVPASPVYDDYELQPNAGGTDPVPQGVRTLHYVPAIINANGTQLVPVYATVRDL